MKLKSLKFFILIGAAGAIVILLAVWILHVVQASFVSDIKGQVNEPITLKFYHVYPENETSAQSLQDIIDDFNDSQNKIRVEGYAGISVDEQLISIMSGNAPDVGYTFWPNSIRWTQNGALEPLTPFIKKNGFNIDDFLATTIHIAQYNNDIYSIPFYVQTMALYYNIDLLNEAGFDQPPSTMEELKLMSKRLTQLNENEEIETMGFLPDYPWIDNVLWPILFGAEFYDIERNEVTTTSKEYLEAIEFQNWFYQQWGWNQISKFKLGFGSDEQEPFYKGKLAMMMGGEWVAREIKQFVPDLKYGVCPFPYPENRPDLEKSSFISPAVIYMPSGTLHKEEAWEFISFLASTESMLNFANSNKSLMARKSVITNPQIKNDPDLRLLAEFALSENTRSFPPLPIVDEYLYNLTEQTNLVFKQKKTPYEAMGYVKSKIDPLLKK